MDLASHSVESIFAMRSWIGSKMLSHLKAETPCIFVTLGIQKASRGLLCCNGVVEA